MIIFKDQLEVCLLRTIEAASKCLHSVLHQASSVIVARPMNDGRSNIIELFCGLSDCSILLVVSTDRCNTLCEFLCWRLILQGLARSFVELPCDSAEFCLAMDG